MSCFHLKTKMCSLFMVHCKNKICFPHPLYPLFNRKERTKDELISELIFPRFLKAKGSFILTIILNPKVFEFILFCCFRTPTHDIVQIVIPVFPIYSAVA